MDCEFCEKMKAILIFVMLLCMAIGSCHLGGKRPIDSVSSERQCEYENVTERLGVGMLVWDGDCSAIIEIYEDSLLQTGITVNLCENTERICPYFYKPDYEIAHFIVNEVCSEGYEILYNFDKRGYVKKTPSFRFQQWDQYLLDIPLPVNVKGDSSEFEILKVVGDSLLNSENRWVRWRKDERLLLDLYFTM